MSHGKLPPTLGESIDSFFNEMWMVAGMFSIVLIVAGTIFVVQSEHSKRYEVVCQVNGGEVYQKTTGWTVATVCLKNNTEIKVKIND